MEYVSKLNDTYDRVQIFGHMSDMFPFKNGLKQVDALSQILFKFALKYTMRRVQADQEDLKLSGTYQLLVYADDVNLLIETICTTKKNMEALLLTRKEVGLRS
jgi:hypothetical protein